LIKLITERVCYSIAIARIKSKNGMQITCPSREVEVLRSRKQWAGNLKPDFVESLFKMIMEYSREVQRNKNPETTYEPANAAQ